MKDLLSLKISEPGSKASSGRYQTVWCKHCKGPKNGIKSRLETLAAHLDKCEEFNKMTGLPVVNPKKHLRKRPRSLIYAVDENKGNVEKFPKLLRGVPAYERDISLLNVDRSDPEKVMELMRELCPLSAERTNRFKSGLMRTIACSHLPFNVVEQGWLRAMLAPINPFVLEIMPSKHTIRAVLKDEVSNIEDGMQKLEETAFADNKLPASVTLAMDVWISPSRERIMGAHFSCKGASYPTSVSMQHQRETAVNVAKIAEELLSGKEHFVTNYVSDDAASNRKARRILALRYPHMLFHKCLAHQINLIVKDFLRISGGVVELNKVQKVVTTIQSSNLHGNFLEACKKFYGSENRSFALKSISRIRWNSSHLSICSVLRVRRALFRLAKEVPSLSMFDAKLIRNCSKMEKLLRVLTGVSYGMQKVDQNMAFALRSFLLTFQTVKGIDKKC